MPGQAGARGAAADQFFREDRMEVVHGVGLHRGRILPAEAEFADAAFHGADLVTDLVLQPVGAEVAVAHSTLGIGCPAFERFTAAGDHERLAIVVELGRVNENAWNDGSAGGSISGQTLLRATGLIVPSYSPHSASVLT